MHGEKERASEMSGATQIIRKDSLAQARVLRNSLGDEYVLSEDASGCEVPLAARMLRLAVYPMNISREHVPHSLWCCLCYRTP